MGAMEGYGCRPMDFHFQPVIYNLLLLQLLTYYMVMTALHWNITLLYSTFVLSSSCLVALCC